MVNQIEPGEFNFAMYHGADFQKWDFDTLTGFTWEGNICDKDSGAVIDTLSFTADEAAKELLIYLPRADVDLLAAGLYNGEIYRTTTSTGARFLYAWGPITVYDSSQYDEYRANQSNNQTGWTSLL
jgi:hypothetical protein